MAYSVPPVSWDDLLDFQARHFITRDGSRGQNYLSSTWDGQEDPDDDGLGYYADGVKRTLTDEQIEIFRHSEIQTLLRERRLKSEGPSEKGSENAPSEVNDSDAQMDFVDAAFDEVADTKEACENEAIENEIADTSNDQVNNSGSHEDDRQNEEPQSANRQSFTRRIVSYDD